MDTFNKISIIGLGYIGLPTAALFASKGIRVSGVDINAKTIETINNGGIHIVEPDLDVLVKNVVKGNRLKAVDTPEPADAFVITVPTPFKNNHEPDLAYVEKAIQAIAPVIKKNDLIILESTSPVGTTHYIAEELAKLRKDLTFPQQDSLNADVAIAYCPERVMPGQILRELIDNDRIIGGISLTCAEKAKSLYKIFVKGECFTTDSKTAEMAKLTENAYRDVNIAFANELSIICDKLNLNVWELIKLANRHPRVSILQPGAGVGGHCIAVDPWFLVNAAPKETKLIRAARETNDAKPYYIVEKIKNYAAHYSQPAIACLGMTYKANTDDLRESPALTILQELALNTDYQINIVEPNIYELPAKFSDNKQIKLMKLKQAIAQSQIIVILVAHREFKLIKPESFTGKDVLYVTNLEEHEAVTTSSLFHHENRPVSEYGRMMMNKIYGHIP